MLREAERTEVVPGLRQFELTQAIRSVHNASGNNGFMMAWQNTENPYPMGFCYLVSANSCLVAIHAKTKDIGNKLNYDTKAHHNHNNDRDTFVDQYLKASAEDIGISYVELVNYLGRPPSLWRFESFIDGKPDKRWGDNSIAWRALWGRIIEAEHAIAITVPLEMQWTVPPKLKSFAVEGQIVLNR